MIKWQFKMRICYWTCPNAVLFTLQTRNECIKTCRGIIFQYSVDCDQLNFKFYFVPTHT